MSNENQVVEIPGFIRLKGRDANPWWAKADDIAIVAGAIGDEFNSAVEMNYGGRSYAKETPCEVAAKIKAAKAGNVAEKIASDEKWIPGWQILLDQSEARVKELEATVNAWEKAAENIVPGARVVTPESLAGVHVSQRRIQELEARVKELEAMGGVAWALSQCPSGHKDILGKGAGTYYSTREDAENAKTLYPHPEIIDVVPCPIGSAAEAINAANERAEKAEAELEEVKRRQGGVAWALKRRLGGDLNRNSQNSVILYESRKDAEKVAPNSGVTWDAVPYPIGSAAEAINAANKRAEKAEDRIKELESELAAAKAEPVKLDPDRVLLTAHDIVRKQYNKEGAGSPDRQVVFTLYVNLSWLINRIGCGEKQLYDLAE